MNASEFAYWYRHGHGPIFGADLDPSKKPSPFAVAAQAVRQTGRGIGQVLRTVTPRVSWSDEQREDIRAATQKASQAFMQTGRGIGRGVQKVFHPKGRDTRIAERQISFAPPSSVSPFVTDEEAAQIRFGPSTAIRGEMFGLEVESSLDEIDQDLEELEEESFGLAPFIIPAAIGIVSAAPAIAMAFKGKKGRLKALQKKLEKLEAKAEGVEGKKADRIGRKIERLEARIEKLKGKLDEPIDELGDDEDEKMGAASFLFEHRYGLGPGLGSTYTFVPAALEDEDSPYATFGGDRVSVESGLAIQELSSIWLGRAGVVQIRDDMWREGPVLVVSTVDGTRPSGFPKRVRGMRIVFVRSGVSYGSIPTALQGSHQLWPADAATADEGTILSIPVVSDHRLDPSTEDSVREGVREFLSARERRMSRGQIGR